MNKHTPIAIGLLALLCSCNSGSGGDIYPTVYDAFVNLGTDARGRLSTLILDDGKTYTLTNESQKVLKADTTFRAVVTYEINGSEATLYNSIVPVIMLSDSTTAEVKTDPVQVVGIWTSGQYINLHLAPKTYNAKPQYFGYAVERVDKADATHPHSHTYINIHHNQNSDPTSFSANAFCSIANKEIGTWQSAGDTLTISVNTFNGTKKWSFTK